MHRHILIASTALTGALFAATAQAQDSTASASEGFEDIVVTAQRREESLEDVPSSVTSLDAEALLGKGVQSTQDLTVAVPGLFWARSTNFNQPTIRGVGSRNSSPGDEPNVATYFDGVYQPDQIGTLFELAGIERIEVLKGPQGTLFGRNATGGAINIITRKPSFDQFSGSLSASYGEYNYRKGSIYLTGPLAGDTLAASISAVAFDDDGYVKNLVLNKKTGTSGGLAIRPKLLFKPSESVSIQLNALYTESDNNVLLAGYAIGGNTFARVAATRPVLNPLGLTVDQAVTSRPYTTTSAFQPTSEIKSKLIDGHLEADLGFATLTGVVAAGRTKGYNKNASDGSPFALSITEYTLRAKYEQTEWLLTSPSNGPFTWLVGAQGFKGYSRFEPLISTSKNATTGAVTVSTVHRQGQRTKAISAFAEGTYEVVPQFKLTGGIRYSWDEKTGFNRTNALPEVKQTASFDNFSPRVVAQYETADGTNLYASFTKGYKSGIINTTATSTRRVDPEKITAYEVGVKTTIADRVRFSLAAYHYDYKDLQVASFIFLNNIATSTVQNAGKVKINGLEGNATILVADGLTLDASVSLIDSKISDFPTAVIQSPTGGLTGNTTVSSDVGGKELIRAPDYTFSLGLNYERPLGSGKITANATAFFSGEYFVEVSNRVRQPAYEIVNASIKWTSDQGYYFSVFGQNLTDQIYGAGFFVATFLDNTQAMKPRWFGATIGYDF